MRTPSSDYLVLPIVERVLYTRATDRNVLQGVPRPERRAKRVRICFTATSRRKKKRKFRTLFNLEYIGDCLSVTSGIVYANSYCDFARFRPSKTIERPTCCTVVARRW